MWAVCGQVGWHSLLYRDSKTTSIGFESCLLMFPPYLPGMGRVNWITVYMHCSHWDCLVISLQCCSVDCEYTHEAKCTSEKMWLRDLYEYSGFVLPLSGHVSRLWHLLDMPSLTICCLTVCVRITHNVGFCISKMQNAVHDHKIFILPLERLLSWDHVR